MIGLFKTHIVQINNNALDAVVKAGMMAVMSGDFPARGFNLPLKECLDKVSKTDLVVSIVAQRYVTS